MDNQVGSEIPSFGSSASLSAGSALGLLRAIGRTRKILPDRGDMMLRFMDWSVVAMGCVLILGSLGGRWWERAKVPKGDTSDPRARYLWAWLPLLMGLGMIGAKVPGLLHAPHPVVEIVDALDFVLAVTVLIFVIRSGRRFFRPRSTT
ncbi:hypothetical protein ACWDE0_02290 [Streptomyces sp. 900105755]|uniref:hypothetical protein n=1 Tax=Streptomyces sp. Ag109_O5-10 TaxID=1855349 RepID=UPI000B81EAF6|nr:hypothetical protein [Streptomyces sp. Ag109_O5-10]